MFSGIVQCQTRVISTLERPGILVLSLERPASFKDLHLGDSVSVDGVCLTVEAVSQDEMAFAVGQETLKVTGWTVENLKEARLNVEQSLRFGERVHGHFVSGHVDAVATVLQTEDVGEWRLLVISLPESLRGLVWKKGSVSINGVSLTVNEVNNGSFTVGLIPETIKRTNLGQLGFGDRVNLEADLMARGVAHWMSERGAHLWD